MHLGRLTYSQNALAVSSLHESLLQPFLVDIPVAVPPIVDISFVEAADSL